MYFWLLCFNLGKSGCLWFIIGKLVVIFRNGGVYCGIDYQLVIKNKCDWFTGWIRFCCWKAKFWFFVVIKKALTFLCGLFVVLIFLQYVYVVFSL